MRRRYGPLVVVAALMCLTISARTGIGKEGPGQPAFEKSMEKAMTLLKQNKGKQGLAHLKTMLEKHKGQNYARAKHVELEDLAKRLAFSAEFPPPDPKTLVSGKLKKYTTASGQITIAYTPKTVGDFTRQNDMYYHKAEFAGPFTVKIKGPRYPSKSEDSPTVLIGGGEHPKTKEVQLWQITFGSPPRDEGMSQVWLPATIRHFDGDKDRTIASKEITPAKARKPFTLVVKVTRSKISATLNGKSLGSAKKPKELFGLFAFDAKGWTEMTITGAIEPSWIQSLVDEVVQEQRSTFAFDRSDYLPDWLFEAPTEEPDSEDRREGNGWPEDVDSMHTSGALSVIALIVAERYDDVFERIDALRERDYPESLLSYLGARARLRMGDREKALRAIDRCLQTDAGFPEGLVLKSTILALLGRSKDAGKLFEQMMATSRPDVSACETAALEMLLAGRPNDGKKFVQIAMSHGVTSEYLKKLNQLLVQSVSGPSWSRFAEIKTANYHVISDIDKETCREAAKVLEEAFTLFRSDLEWVARDKSRRFKVFLFSGEEGFENYLKETALLGKPIERAAGLYSPMLKQLLIWNLPSRDEMINTIRHEGFHQYLDRFMPNAPTWFDEGLAVYYENAIRVGGHLKAGQMHKSYLEMLESEEPLPLKKFVYGNAKDFYANGSHSYAQGWALVHMLRHGKTEYRQLFKKLVKEFQLRSAADAQRSLISDEDLDLMELEFERYLGKLNK